MDSVSSKNSKVYIVIVVYQMVQQLDLTMFLELFLLMIGERSKRAAKGMVFNTKDKLVIRKGLVDNCIQIPDFSLRLKHSCQPKSTQMFQISCDSM